MWLSGGPTTTTTTTTMVLNPEAVRLRASSIPQCYEWKVSVVSSPSAAAATSSPLSLSLLSVPLSPTSDEKDSTTTTTTTTTANHICSFLVGIPDDIGNSSTTTNTTKTASSSTVNLSSPNVENVSSKLARVTIYCQTGTIMTSRILNGCVRNLFRKNVTSLDIVERCLRHPPELPTIDWNLIGPTIIMNSKNNNNNNNSTFPTSGTNQVNDTTVEVNQMTQSIPKNLELINIGIAILTSERDKLVQHAKTLEHSKVTKTETTTTKSSSSTTTATGTTATPNQSTLTNHIPKTAMVPTTTTTTTTTTTGMEFQFSLSAGPMKHVDQCLHDIQQMGKLVKWVATNGVGTVFLYGNGGVAYTPNIPHLLYQRLSQLRSSKLHSSRPKYVTLGTKDRFFVTFYDNTYYYSKGLKMMDRELKKMSTPPVSVAFGTTYDTFCMVYDDGTYKYHGRGIPTEFITRLNTSATIPSISVHHRLSHVTLGPSGEWFVRFHNGQVDYGNISSEMNRAIQELRNDGYTIKFLDFGENGSYFVSYD